MAEILLGSMRSPVGPACSLPSGPTSRGISIMCRGYFDSGTNDPTTPFEIFAYFGGTRTPWTDLAFADVLQIANSWRVNGHV